MSYPTEFKEIVGQLNCDEVDSGTAFLVDSDIAITSGHCVEKHYKNKEISITIKFMYLPFGSVTTNATLLSPFDKDIVLLKLDKVINNVTRIPLSTGKMPHDTPWEAFGYPVFTRDPPGKRLKGQVLEFHSPFPQGGDIELLSDLSTPSFKGVSGSPVFISGYIRAVIVSEGQATLYAKSVDKFSELLDKYEIRYEHHDIIPSSNISYSLSRSSNEGLWQDGIETALTIDTTSSLAIQLSEKQLHLMREAWLEGRKNEAIKWITEIKNDRSEWQKRLSDKVKAQILCFEASLELNITGNISRAKQLADEAHSLYHPLDSEIRLSALIAYREHGSEKAIEYLASQEDIDSINLKAAFLLEMGQISECRQTLTSLNIHIEPNAETFRIKAFSYLVEKKVYQARLEIQKAIELKPQWERVRFADALIHYFSALSPVVLPGFLPNHSVNWPEPVDWMFVKRDDESITHFRKAAEIFQKLTEEAQREGKEFQSLQTWHFACLANDIERQTEAITYCQQLLQADPTDYRLILWVLSRNFDIEIEPSIAALEGFAAESSANIFHIIALTGCYLVTQHSQKAIAVLNDAKPIFQQIQADELWEFWFMQSLIASGDFKTTVATTTNSEATVNLKYGQAIALQEHARETGDWQEFFQHLDESFKETGDPHFLLEYCRLKAQRQDWSDIAERAEQLVQEIGTSESLRLAAISAYNAEQFDRCLKLLDEYRNLFGQNQLPAELRRMRVSCLHVLGLIPEAIAEKETLAREEATTEHLFGLVNLYSAKGDLDSLVIIARQLSNRPDLTSEQALRLASQVYYKNRQLATSLWRSANNQRIPDEWVMQAVTLGYQFGLDDEMSPLLERIEKLAIQEKEGVQIKKIEELIVLKQQWHEHGVKSYELYQSGVVPIHLLTKRFNRPLADFYHRFLKNNEANPDPLKQIPLFIRHGGRLLVSGFPKNIPNWRLNLDITAILLATHLGILPDVESVFKPLHIPQTLIPALEHMRDKLTHPQPSRLIAYRQIVDLVKMEVLKVVQSNLPSDYPNKALIAELGEEWVAFFEDVKAKGGYWVEFLPLEKLDCSGPPTALPEDAGQYFVTCRGIVEALWRDGPLSQEEYEKAIKYLGQQVYNGDNTVVPPQGSPLYLRGAIPELLAGTDLLYFVCDRFQVFIEQKEFDRVCSELQESEQKRATIEWLNNLINRIRDGIDNEIYEMLPLPFGRNEEFKAVTQEEPAEVGCLINLMGVKAQEKDVIWIDDRWANSYFHVNGVPIIGINEILKTLVSAKVLTQSEYYAKVTQLRKANVRFIPLEADEILFHFQQARVADGEVKETEGLRVLRRYMAACLLHGENLQKPPVPDDVPNKNGEIAFPIVGLDRAVMSVLTKLWVIEDDDKTRLAYAEWILENLYVDHLGIQNLLSSPGTEQSDLLIASLTLAGFLTYAISLGVHQIEQGCPMRREYMRWAFERIIRRRIHANPSLLNGIAEDLKRTFLNAREDIPNGAQEEITIWILQQLYEDLPKPIKDELAHDADFMAKIEIKHVTVIDIEDLTFDKDTFFQTAYTAINGRKARIIPHESEQYIVFQPFHKSETYNAFYFYHPKTKEKKIIKRDELQLLHDSPSEREAVLHRHQEWLDCPTGEFERHVAKIASIESPVQRIEEIETWEKSSAAMYYSDLYQKLRRRESFQPVDLMPPHLEGLLRHLRFSNNNVTNGSFQELLTASVQTFIDDRNIVAIIERFGGLPVQLPTIIIESIATRELEDKRNLVKRLLPICLSPISKFHLVSILFHLGDENSAFYRLARLKIKSLVSSKGIEDFNAFLALLKWIHEEINRREEVCHWSHHLRLATTWAHTNRLFTVFLDVGGTSAWLLDLFSNWNARQVSFETFDREVEYWSDVAHPQKINYLPFLFTGLSYSLEGRPLSVIDEDLRQFLARQVMSCDEEGQYQIAFSLLRDPAQMQNCLNSFLGRERGEVLLSLLGMRLALDFTRPAVEALVEMQIDQLAETPGDFAPWGILREVFADLPLHQSVAERLPAIIFQTDFVQLCENNRISGMFITEFVSLQLKNFQNEELRFYVKEQVVKIAQLFARISEGINLNSLSPEERDDLDKLSNFLIEFARNIALATQPSQDTVEDFVETLTQIIKAWDFMTLMCKPLVLVLIEELPITQAKKFWRLLEYLRAN